MGQSTKCRIVTAAAVCLFVLLCLAVVLSQDSLQPQIERILALTAAEQPVEQPAEPAAAHQTQQPEHINARMLQLAEELAKNLSFSMKPLPGFPGLTGEAFRNQRIVTLGDSTMNYWSIYGLFPMLNILQYFPNYNFDTTLLEMENFIKTQKLINVTGKIWDHEVYNSHLNTTITHYQRDMCKHFAEELIQTILDDQPTVFIFNVGLHMMHMVTEASERSNERSPEKCAIALWHNHSKWLDFIVKRIPSHVTLIYHTTITVGDDEFSGAWKSGAQKYKNNDTGVLHACQVETNDAAYCENMSMIRENTDKLTADALTVLGKHNRVLVLPYHTLTHDLPPAFHSDGRHHRFMGGTKGQALTFTRTRMLSDLLLLQQQQQKQS